MQLMLDVYSCLCLDNETSQTQQKKPCGNHVLLASCLGGIVFRGNTPDGGPTGVVQHGPVLCIPVKARLGKPSMAVVLE